MGFPPTKIPLNMKTKKEKIIDTFKKISFEIKTISTGIKSLDNATGIGGYPFGRIVEIFGLEASGKTTLALLACKSAQDQGLVPLYVDMEQAMNIDYATKLGVDISKWHIVQPSSGEEALEIVYKVLEQKASRVVVVDSIPALVPRAELEGEIGDVIMGGLPRLMGQACRKYQPLIRKYNALIIFINQIRLKIGVMFGNPETTPGGKAIPYAASMRFDIRRTGPIKKGNEIIGAETKIKVVKNKLAVPYKETIVDLIYGEGFRDKDEDTNRD